MKISIIIPCYNDEKNLRNCLKTIPKDSNIEIIVIDDYSTCPILDATFRTPKNLGPGFARQKGLELSTGDYIIFMDSDDCFMTEFFEYYWNGIKKNYSIIRDKQYYPYGTIQGICFKREILKDITFLQDFFFQDIIFLLKVYEKIINLKQILLTKESLWTRKNRKGSLTDFKNYYTSDILGLFSTPLLVKENINKKIILERLKNCEKENFFYFSNTEYSNMVTFFKSLIEPSINIDKRQAYFLLKENINKYFFNESEKLVYSLNKYLDIAMEL